ncbi:MAG: HmuY family protein [Chitinophagaceae bacterium]|nr:HmuY family protein [Chitinophagaceae bacterium]
MRNRFLSCLLIAACIGTLVSCDKDETPVPVIPPSEGQTSTINADLSEEVAAKALNSVFIDLSTDKATAVARESWDLKFYNGDQFRVKINNTNGASAIAVDATDINSVSLEDLAEADTLSIDLGEASDFVLIDNPVSYNVSETVISEVSATDASNKVYIINPAGGSHTIPFDETKLWKIRVLRKSNGYTLQYAKISETTFKTLEVTKDANFNYQFVSLTTGALVNVEPAKAEWDIQWTWSMYYANFGENVPYSFADLIFINSLGGVQAAEVLTSAVTYDAYTETNIASTAFSSSYDAIGSKWRATTGTIGVKTDRFYVVKDGSGNVYKVKFVSFHANDGGVRGKPVIEYKLVKQG